jgi:malonyl-CoA/methylmalonyl-CoA synthetase
MPGVAESAVVGVPHPDFGEAVVAVVVPKPGATLDGQAIIAALKTQIANFKVPKQVFVVDRTAAQHHGQGAEEPAARAAQGLVRAERHTGTLLKIPSPVQARPAWP